MYLSSDASKLMLNGRKNSLTVGVNSSSGASAAKGAKKKTSVTVTVPFHDLDSSSEEAEEFLRKPYTDDFDER